MKFRQRKKGRKNQKMSCNKTCMNKSFDCDRVKVAEAREGITEAGRGVCQSVCGQPLDYDTDENFRRDKKLHPQ